MSYFLMVPLGLVLIYCILITGAAVFAPKAGAHSRVAYLIWAIGLTLMLGALMMSGYDIHASKLTWSLGTLPGPHISTAITRATSGGEYVVPAYLPMLSLIPLALSFWAGFSLRRYIATAAAKKALSAAAEHVAS